MSANLSFFSKSRTAFFVLSGIALGSLIAFSSYAAVFVLLGLASALFVSKSPLRALSFLILLIPFTETSYLKDAFIAVPGVKPMNILAVFVAIIALANHESAQKFPTYSMIFAFLFLSLFGISIFRSLPHLDVINALRENELSPLRYLLSDLVKPLIYFMPFVITVFFIKKRASLKSVTSAVAFSVGLLAVYQLYLCAFKIPDIRDVDEASKYYSFTLGMHRNDLANFYILGFPAILGRFFLKKGVISISALLLVIIATGFLFSRTAYFGLLLSFVLYLVFSKRAKLLPVFLAALLGLSLIVSSAITERASKGFKSGNWDEIFAGRIVSIWLPLVDECLKDPIKLLFGNGRYAILSSECAARGTILESIEHPHNMYLEQVLDAGVCGLITVLAFFAILLRKCYNASRNSNEFVLAEYYHIVTVTIISYFFAGMTGRSLFPTLSNSYLWVIAGLAIALNRLSENAKQERNKEA